MSFKALSFLYIALVHVCVSEGLTSSQPFQCTQWYHYYNTTTHDCMCLPVWLLTCDPDDSDAYIDSLHILSYDAIKQVLSLTVAPGFQSQWRYNLTRPGQIQLPENITKLNEYICAPLNRKGYMCMDCVEGFGPSMIQTSYTGICYDCRETWRGVILYLCLEFGPLTAFYFLILLFQVRVTSAPMTSYIMYSQLIVMAFQVSSWNNHLLNMILHDEKGDLRSMSKIFLTFYGVFNLEFFRHVINPFCISNELTSIHVVLLGYISAFYPFLLITLTWICVNLHDRNFQPLVILWKQFHRNFAQLHRKLVAKSDITDVFASFFLLSYTKVIYQTLLMLSTQKIFNFSLISHSIHYSYVLSVDANIVSGTVKYVSIFIMTIIVFIVFNIFPLLLIILYPFQKFRCILSKLRLNTIAINHFVEKFHYCYRDGLDGGRDMRSFAGSHMLLRIVIVSVVLLFYNIFHFQLWFLRGITFSITAMLVALCKPYKKTYANILDTVFLIYLAIFCQILSSNRLLEIRYFVPIMQTIIFIPLSVFIIIIFGKLMHKWCKSLSQKSLLSFRVNRTHCCQAVNPVATYGTMNS